MLRKALLIWAVFALTIGAWGILPPAEEAMELSNIVGGAGPCFWTDYPACPGPAGFCDGCNAANVCTNPNGQLWNTYSYSSCTNTSMGLTECSLPTTIYCHTDTPCETDCVLVNGMRRCIRKVDGDGNLIETDATPKTQTHASGDFCGVA